MEPIRAGQLRQVVEISRQMLTCALANDWTGVSELQRQRDQLVRSCFRQPAAEPDAAEVEPAIREILQLNDQISSLGRDCQAQLVGEIRVQKLRSSAASAYLSNARR